MAAPAERPVLYALFGLNRAGRILFDVHTHRGAITPLVAAIEARNVALMTYLEAHGAREKP